MNILLVDDSVKHRRAGKAALEAIGHTVTAVSTYTEARRIAGETAFDVALLDLLMPAESQTLGSEAIKEHVGREIAIGFPLMLELARSIRWIAIATDTNHHTHPMSAAVDWLERERLTVDDANVLVMHAPLLEGGAKDWVRILELLLKKLENASRRSAP